jgi:hypothetical protein
MVIEILKCYQTCTCLLELILKQNTGGEGVLSQIFMGDETCIPPFGTRIQAEVSEMVPHETSPRKKKSMCVPSAGKIMVTISWDVKGVNFVNFIPRSSSELCLLY